MNIFNLYYDIYKLRIKFSVPPQSDVGLTSRLLLGRALFWVNCFIAVQLLAELQLPLGLFAAWDLVKRRSLEVPEAKHSSRS